MRTNHALINTFLITLSIFCFILPVDSTPQSKVTVVIDPGHPSENGIGARSLHGFREIDINWEIASRVRSLLTPGTPFRVLLTGESKNETVTNRRRAEIANAASAALMLRIHCDSGRGHGATLYYPSEAGTLGNVSGPAPEVCSASANLAKRLQTCLSHTLKEHFQVNPIKTDRQTAIGARQGALTGSIFSRVPVVTVELGYLDNPQDERFLTSSATQQLLAEALAASIRETVNFD